MKIKTFALDGKCRTIASGKTRWLICLIAFVVLALGNSSPGLAQTDPFVGTWKMNPAKSTFTPGPARKNEIRIVEESPKGMKISVDGTNGDGTNQQFNYTTNLNGTSYPITGIAPYSADSVSEQMTSPNSLSFNLTKSGKVVGAGTSVVSPDGKTLTLKSKGKDKKGKVSSSVVLYDKQ